ncbi:hypothetical protein [uncultured Amnibacterium sp.]|uniref:hypothetical protein n=1 Tax=uncultured Amnibacterium sp. TaxID=1631851 RepID=UPI0035C98AF9
MATYGFRIHTLTPYLQRHYKTLLNVEDVSRAGGEPDSLNQVYNQLIAMRGDTKFGTPTYMTTPPEEAVRLAAQEAAENLAYFTVLDVSRLGRTIEVLVETGRESDHDGIRRRDGSLEDARGRAAIRTSTVLLVFPTAGEHAFMVSEVRGRGSAGVLLMDWVTRLAQRAAVSYDEGGIRTELPWLNWKPTPRIDGERLDGILERSSNFSFTLRREAVSSTGERKSYDIEVVQYGLKKTPVEAVLNVLMKLSSRKHSGTEAQRRVAAAADVLTLVEPDITKVEFTDAEMSFDENGKKQTVTSETVDELFIYPLGSDRPSASKLKSVAGPIIERIAANLNSQVATDAEEEGA